MSDRGKAALTVKEANQHQRTVLKDFISFPYRLYRDNPNWVPLLRADEKRFFNKKKNPFMKHNPVVLYVCYQNGTPVGRIAGIINRDHNGFHKDHTAFFGFFESIDDEAVAETLFRTVTRWVKDQGADALRGPTNFTLNDVSGLLIEGFNEPPFVMMPYNPGYYEKLYRKNGFDIAMRFFAYEVTAETIRFPSFIDKFEKRLQDNDIIIRTIDYKRFDRDFEICVEIFNEAWHDNWGFTPIGFEEAVTEFRKVKVFTPQDLLFIAEHRGIPVGFAFALPDINQVLISLKGRMLPFNWIRFLRDLKKIDRIRVALMGVKKEHRSKGIDLMFYKKIVDNSVKHGCHRAELSWILENNQMMNRVLQHIDAHKTKTYAIFEKKID